MIVESRLLIINSLTNRLLKEVFVDSKINRVYNIQTKINNKVFLASKQEQRTV